MFTKKDIAQIHAQGLSLEQIKAQLRMFNNGVPHITLAKPATVSDGIQRLNKTQQEDCIRAFERIKSNKKIYKFVPASGAASRMFKFLHLFLESDTPPKQLETYLSENPEATLLHTFVKGFTKFPFHKNIEVPKTTDALKTHLKTLLFTKQFSELPKALIPFHKMGAHTQTAFEAQLLEASLYAQNQGEALLHFTISYTHLKAFEEALNACKKRIFKDTGVNFKVQFSFQEPNTDTLAVTPENMPFRDSTGALVFRPAGHGALLQNLNTIEADWVFIKNIDNVSMPEDAQAQAYYKKILGGFMASCEQQIHQVLRAIKENQPIPSNIDTNFRDFCAQTLAIHLPENKAQWLTLLNKPIRVCGVVKNEGAPGGGPFWVEGPKQETLQIVEGAQVNTANSKQKEIWQAATHFNPVDLVCGLTNFEGKPFNLTKYCDLNQSFISNKSMMGQPLKALELPGLWNGSMAHWLTVFVEVPAFTFNPVKTVNDLLNPAHQPKE